jgi:hypothetical protein
MINTPAEKTLAKAIKSHIEKHSLVDGNATA